MDTARCILDGRDYDAQEFSQLETTDIQQKRYNLTCIECNATAFFRRASRNGRAACFGASHAEGCMLAATEAEQVDGEYGDDEDQIENLGERIIVDFNYGTAHPNVIEAETQDNQGQNRLVQHRGPHTRQTNNIHRRLSSLLRSLIHSETFRQSNLLIELPSHGQYIVRDLFCNFTEITDQHVGQFKGYWGLVVDVGIGQAGLWFNSGNRENASVVIDSGIVGSLNERYGQREREDFAGSYILAFGDLRVSQNNKRYIAITESQHYVLRLAD